MLVSVSTTVVTVISPLDCARGRKDFDLTCPCDVDDIRGMMNRIRNTRSHLSNNGNMSAKRAEPHKRRLSPLNEDEQ